MAATHRSTDSMEPVFHHVTVPADRARLDWNQLVKRVVIDAVDGIVSRMSPDVTHEWMSGRTESLVGIVTQRLKPQCYARLSVAEMRRADSDDVEILDLRKSGRSDTSSALRGVDRDPLERVIDIRSGLNMNSIQRLINERVSPRPPMTRLKFGLRTDG